MIGKPFLSTCLLLGATIIAAGCSRRDDVTRCKSVNADTRIAGCTALIQAGQQTTDNLSVIYSTRGAAYDDKGDYDRAIRDLNEAIRLNPNAAGAYYGRGYAYKKKGDYDQAIQDFNEAIRLNPKFERAYYDRGNAYIDKDDYDRAIQEFNEAIRLNPTNPNNYNNRGVAYHKKGDYGRATQDYSQAIRLNSNDVASFVNRGDSYFAQSNLTAAIADYEHTITVTPSSNMAVFAAVMLHIAMKRQGHDDSQQLARVAAAADLSKWPGPVLKLDLGQMTPDDVMMAPASPVPDTRKRQVCEANYFTAEDALLHHQQTTAISRLEAARDGCPKGDTDYAAALAELKRLGIPAPPSK